MHFSTLFAASLALAPAVYGNSVSVVEVEVHGHDNCHVGRLPGNNLEEHSTIDSKPKKVFPTENSCPSVKLPDHDEVDTYSFTVTALNKKSFEQCRGLGVYTNKECAGNPDWIVPFHPGELRASSPCLPEYGFEDYVSLQLICNDDPVHRDEGKSEAHGEGNKEGEGEGNKEGEGEGNKEGEGEGSNKGEGEAEQRQGQAEKPAAKSNSIFGKLGL
ncbi:hypothetical protein F9C07_2232304 [Aspergillus flavus]|uniref:Uncharacterized protein n=3 Tax=Aspergillus subgen. Circumdati TaxID=2720871 RepID=B8N4R6_ASPFN|nr:uncharacterized protein G4B84_006329 [Aspergillus flavus NRRL3357]KAJ1708323.1 hypothetical protein NYO67_9527 [Aspergillus flavus]KOC12691.1 hypothetical protein AFLA70_53g003571 [Aspergillus flavus AF70]OOO11240.1 hypothetical protein OAory_01077100 [Aspergillus oryzae]KAF7625366.1 hypothetical protein AFLA_002232 [Aspergillus flavus NRRL3357]QMW30948.1 hypothetical protein G4B84_006329 [Aspergillus flavus NRRL3357]